MRILDRTPSFFFGHLLGQPLEFPVAGWPSEASIFIHSDQAVGFSVGVSTGAGVMQEVFQVARGVAASCCHPTRHCCGGVGFDNVPHVPLHRTVSVTRCPHDVSPLDVPFHPTVDGEKDPIETRWNRKRKDRHRPTQGDPWETRSPPCHRRRRRPPRTSHGAKRKRSKWNRGTPEEGTRSSAGCGRNPSEREGRRASFPVEDAGILTIDCKVWFPSSALHGTISSSTPWGSETTERDPRVPRPGRSGHRPRSISNCRASIVQSIGTFPFQRRGFQGGLHGRTRKEGTRGRTNQNAGNPRVSTWEHSSMCDPPRHGTQWKQGQLMTMLGKRMQKTRCTGPR